jgi:plastocyanin
MKRWIVAPMVALAVVVTACSSTPRSGNVHAGSGGPDAVEVTLHDNEGSNQHTFTIDELDLSTGTMKSGDVVTAMFTVPDGTTEFQCTFHSGMNGRIVAT